MREWRISVNTVSYDQYGDLLAVSKTCKEKEFTVSQKEFYLWFVQVLLFVYHPNLACRLLTECAFRSLRRWSTLRAKS